MKIAAIGDIHGNHYALEACLEQIEKLHIQTIAFLGDYITDCPCPEKTIALLRQAQERYQTYFVRGNREDYMLSHHDDPNDGWTYGSRYGSLLYTYERLTEEDLAWFRSMPESMQVQIDEAERFEICHGSMKTNRYMLLPGSSEWETTLESNENGSVAVRSFPPVLYSRGSWKMDRERWVCRGECTGSNRRRFCRDRIFRKSVDPTADPCSIRYGQRDKGVL